MARGFVFNECADGKHNECASRIVSAFGHQDCTCFCSQDRIELTISKADKARGVVGSLTECPVALTLRRYFPNAKRIMVTTEILDIDGYRFYGSEVHTLRAKKRKKNPPHLVIIRIKRGQ